jgi:hypothetical protein
VRLIESAEAVLGYRPAWTEALLVRPVRAPYRRLCRIPVQAFEVQTPALYYWDLVRSAVSSV